MPRVAACAVSMVMCSLLAACETVEIGTGERTRAPADIDRRVDAIARAHAVDGLGVALIRDGAVVHLHSSGYRDAAHRLPLMPDTVMYGASFTKAAFAVYVMQRVDDGTIDLDRSIAEYLPRPLPDYPRYADLASDPRWRSLTFRTLLDHTSGFANLRRFDAGGRLRIHRDPGTRYGYSGEGMQLAQFVLEGRLGIDLGREMKRSIFDPFAMTRTSMSWREDFDANVADVALAGGTGRPHRRRSIADSAGSVDTTLADMAAFAAAIVGGDGLSRRAKAEMIATQVVIDSIAQFPTMDDRRTEANRSIGLGYGLGWGVFETPRGRAFFKEGHDEGTANYMLCIDRERSCIVLMSNSDRAEEIYATLVRTLMGVDIPWQWEGYGPPMPSDEAAR